MNKDFFEVEVRLNSTKIESFWVTSKIDKEDWKQIALNIPSVKNRLGTSTFETSIRFNIIEFIIQPSDIAKEINSSLHILWTKAVGTKDYVKKEWQNLESLIHKILQKNK